MAPLFQVPGWTVPNEPTSASKKRKRPRASAVHGADDADQITSASINVDKLMRSLDTVLAAEGKAGKSKGKSSAVLLGDDDDDGEDVPERTRSGKRNKVDEGKKGKAIQPSSEGKSNQSKGETKAKTKTKEAISSRSTDMANAPAPSKNKKQKNKPDTTETSTEVQRTPDVPKPDAGSSQMTALQAKMKNSLDGARFRWINEELYKSDSSHALSMMRQDPTIFNEYHTGFRHQVQSWPTNPVEHYISKLSRYPPKTIIADLGCGDATLAKALIPKDMVVLSYDLSSDDAYVTEADVCTSIPLPGAEPEPGTEGPGHGHVVDVVVCALSLMGTNWPGTIRQAWRILKLRGELKIAEVASRFTDIDVFVSLVAKLGFRLATKDTSNTHFTLFEFRKTARKALSKKDWNNLLATGETLKPCEYKRR